MSDGIIWLASYPKSGNTWFRLFIENIVHERTTPADINELDEATISSNRGLFDQVAGIPAALLTHEEVDRLRPEVYRILAREAPKRPLLKTHDAYTQTDLGAPLFPADATAGVLYFIRNPLDVAISYAHHNATDTPTAARTMAETDHALCSHRDRLPNQLRQRLLSWSEHVTSWVDGPLRPVLVLRYEDMHAHPLETFTRAASFCGLPDDPDRVSRALSLCDFGVLQAQEREHGFREKAPHAASFFRRGRTDDWRESLSPDIVERIIADHAPVMRRFGYIDDCDRPILSSPQR